jgi:hypothetical protein
MWKLNKVGNSILNQYVREMIGGLKDRLVTNLTLAELQILIPGYGSENEDLSELEGLLTDEPIALLNRNNRLMAALILRYDENELKEFQKSKRKTKRREPRDTYLVDKYGVTLQMLEDAFNYEHILAQHKERAYRLTEMKVTIVCTYCNRQYVFTVNKPKKKGLEHIVRPELDHWYSKELYPLMSLSFYNLIPSCHTCNSAVKGSAVFSLVSHIHPYLQVDANPKIEFRPTVASGHSSGYCVKIDRVAGSKEDNTVKAFALDEIYAEHGRLEVEDLMRFNSAYNDGYLKILFEDVLKDLGMNYTKAEVYKMLFGTELEPERFGERPMSKLKYDVLKYLHVI